MDIDINPAKFMWAYSFKSLPKYQQELLFQREVTKALVRDYGGEAEVVPMKPSHLSLVKDE
jgi:hypothetical protein